MLVEVGMKQSRDFWNGSLPEAEPHVGARAEGNEAAWWQNARRWQLSDAKDKARHGQGRRNEERSKKI
jgi:hypothetical protein